MKYLCLAVVFLLAGLIVFIVQSSNVILKNKRIFHKRRIIKVTHESGEIDYTVEINGFLGLPFLWQTDEEDMGLYIAVKRGMSLESATKYIDRENRKYLKRIGYKIKKKERYEV